MAVHIKLSSTLRPKVEGYEPMAGMDVEVSHGETALSLVNRLGLDPGEVKVVMLNGRHAALDSLVKSGDRVGFFPAVGGG